VLAYCLVIMAAGLGYSALNGTGWLSGGWAGLGLLAAIITWTVAQMRAVSRLRQLLYGEDREIPGAASDGDSSTVRR
jgi:hypothetical protein